MKQLNKNIFKFLIILFVVTNVFFSPVACATDDGDNNVISTFVGNLLVDLLLNIGDGILYFTSRSVGEVVTIDSIVYNGVDKLSIDYWEADSNTSNGVFLSNAVNKWYDAFYGIAIIAYMLVLVFAGIQILMHSTADKKAQYKEYIVSWVTGVAILCLFPYAMKYIVMLSKTAVTAISTDRYEKQIASPEFLNLPLREAHKFFGEPEFVENMSTGDGDIRDAMLNVRKMAFENKNLVLAAIYGIMLGQVILLLIMYYKRVFMTAFLIIIFPLVAMTFAIDKMGDKKAQSFSIWFKEFVVNVVVQIFHAAIYAVLVGACVNSFVATKGKDWLFMIISITFLFQGERIVRNIFEIKSKANTIGDLAASAIVYKSLLDKVTKSKGNNVSDVASKQDNADKNALSQRVNFRNNVANHEAANEPSNTQNENQLAEDLANANIGDAMDKVSAAASKNRLRSGIASGLAKRGVNVIGGVLGATHAMSKGSADGKMMVNMIADGYAGSAIARGITTPVTSAINIAERRIAGEILANQIESGEMDSELGIDSIATNQNLDTQPSDVDIDKVVAENGESMQSIFREALAEMGRATARGGHAKGEMAFWDYMNKHTKK